MTGWKRILALPLILLVTLAACAPEKEPPSHQEDEGSAMSFGEFRGVWVSTTLNLDYPSQKGLNVQKLRDEAVALLDSAQQMGLNAVLLQVRPCGDALYPSELYPWSQYLSGVQGQGPEDGFDPLAYWIEQAHQRGMELHAWINPFRVTQGGTPKKPKQDVTELAENNPARLHADWTVAYTDGNLYLNPGIPEVRAYIQDGVREILENYAVDGIHFDDYFYPGEDFNDAAAFSAYGEGFSDIGDWRRGNIDSLISETHALVQSVKPGARFGVSPFAIWQNLSSSPQGSDTRGLESYRTHYTDTRKWVKSEWLDYIAPQIYWNIGNTAADYAKLLSWWVDVVKDTKVDLYIGQAGYRSLEAEPGDVWYGSDELKRQIQLNRMYDQVKGSIHFRLGMYLQSQELVSALKSLYLS